MSNNKTPPPVDWAAIARQQGQQQQQLLEQQTRANRPNQRTPFGYVDWTQGQDGQWSQDVGFTGPWAGLAGNLQDQAAQNLGTPFDWGALPQAGTGDEARQQAIDAYYGQATSRLDPMWQQREQAMQSQLLNQGLDPTSEAYRTAMSDFGMQRNDAYGSAMNSAIGAGMDAGNSVFQNNMLARQMALSEGLQQRNQPMADLGSLMGFMGGGGGFNAAGMGQAPDMMGAAQLGNADQWHRYDSQLQRQMQLISALASMMSSGASMSDARAKTDIVRLPFEAMPGVPFAVWKWKPEFKDCGPEFGVIAQDLEAVAPHFVNIRDDGMRVVDYSFLLG